MAMIEAGLEVLILKRASASRSSGHWSDDDYDMLCDGAVVGRIFKANAAPVGTSWMWTLIFPHHEGRTPTHGYVLPEIYPTSPCSSLRSPSRCRGRGGPYGSRDLARPAERFA
jgi:hypothetical protein